MKPNTQVIRLVAMLLLITAVFPLLAKDVSVDCSKKSLQTEIDKLDPLEINSIEISNSCIEDIVIDGHTDLTLIGTPGANITATSLNATHPLEIRDSRVTLASLTLQDGLYNIYCIDRSVCILRDVTSQGGNNGMQVNGQSNAEVLGQSSFINNGTGIFVGGASSTNVRPYWLNGFDPSEPGSDINGNGTGAFVQDGSFFRADSATISGNGTGVWAQRHATLKILGNGPPGASVSNNSFDGIFMAKTSTGQIYTPINDNGGVGLFIGPLSHADARFSSFSNNAGGNIACGHPTSVSQPPCP